MMIFRRFLICLLAFLFLLPQLTKAQQYVTTIGIQYKPIIPFGFLRKDGFNTTVSPITASLQPKNGSSFGMVIRRGLNPRFSVESGINMTSRNYSLHVTVEDTSLTYDADFKWINYEIPVQLLVFIRLGEQLFINASGGFSFKFFPSDIETFHENFYQRTYRWSWIRPNLLANLGFEWRTEKSGYFYLGASYSQPFVDMALTQIDYMGTNPRTQLFDGIRGNYLTLDLRYFFHEDPNRVTRKMLRDRRKRIDADRKARH